MDRLTPEEPIDRYARGELSPEQSRDLALKALDDAELFDDLTAVALAKAAVAPSARSALARWPRSAGVWIAVAAGLAGVAITSKLIRRPVPAPRIPALASVLLAGGLEPRDSTVFRGAAPDSRDPRLEGHVVSVEDGTATVDLGTLDGLIKGSELELPGAGLAVEAVFRERAQAHISGTRKVRAGDQVRVPADAHVRALLDQVDARYARGDLPAARSASQQAVQFAESANLPQRPAAWNRLAVLLMLSGDYSAAGVPLRQALAALPRSDPAYAQSANNLAVLAELGNDWHRAAELYAEALAAAANVPETERRVIESNLARVRGSP